VKQPKRIKPEPKQKKTQPDTDVRVQQQEQQPPSRALTANNVRVTDLPEFTQVDSKWRKVFVPSLYNALFRSEAPFKDFILGTEKFIGIVQNVVDCVYPEVDYTVKRDEPIHLLVRSKFYRRLHLLILLLNDLEGLQPYQ
jgi:hypothetical protein